MTQLDIAQKLAELNLPDGTYTVVGSGTLAALGLRDTIDIDLVITPEIYERFKAAGWREEIGAAGNPILLHDVYDIGVSWGDPQNKPNLAEILHDAFWADGIPYANLERVLAWKQHIARDKDLRDVELIRAYRSKGLKTQS